MRTLDFGHFLKIHSSGKFAHRGSAFFLKILYGRVMCTASCPFLSWSKPRLVPWAPLSLSHIFWVKKKKKKKGDVATKGSVETVPQQAGAEQAVASE